MLTNIEVLTVITSSREEVFKEGWAFLGGHVRSALNTVLSEDGVVICLLRSVERSGIIFAEKSSLYGLWRLSFICTESQDPPSQAIYGMHDIRSALNWEEVIMGMNAEHLFD